MTGIPCPEDHPALDLILDALDSAPGFLAVSRESECVEFSDQRNRRYEVVVREIANDEADVIGDEDDDG